MKKIITKQIMGNQVPLETPLQPLEPFIGISIEPLEPLIGMPIEPIDPCVEKPPIISEFRRGFEYRLKPTQEQLDLFFKYAGAYRFVFNWGLSLIKESMEVCKQHALDKPDEPRMKMLNYFDLAGRLTQLKKQEDHAWLQDAQAQTLQCALKDLDFAMKNFFRRVRQKEQPGFPKFKSKRVSDTFRFPQLDPKHIKERYIVVPKIGKVWYINTRDLVGIPKQMTIKRDGKHWFVAISTIEKKPPRTTPEHPSVVVNMKVNADNTVSYMLTHQHGQDIISTPTFYRDEMRRLTVLTVAMQRKVKDSTNRTKCVDRINKINVTIRNKRKDFLHKLSTDIVKRFNTIIINPLPIKEMIDDEALAISLAECGWFNFCQMLRYKSAYRHKHFSEITEKKSAKKSEITEKKSAKKSEITEKKSVKKSE